jgi:hypothetical protein
VSAGAGVVTFVDVDDAFDVTAAVLLGAVPLAVAVLFTTPAVWSAAVIV